MGREKKWLAVDSEIMEACSCLHQKREKYEAALDKLMAYLDEDIQATAKGGEKYQMAEKLLKAYRRFMVGDLVELKQKATFKIKEGRFFKNEDEPPEDDNRYDLYALAEQYAISSALLNSAMESVKCSAKVVFCTIVDTTIRLLRSSTDAKVRRSGDVLKAHFIDGKSITEIFEEGGFTNELAIYRLREEGISNFALLFSPSGGLGPALKKGKEVFPVGAATEIHQEVEDLFLGPIRKALSEQEGGQ